MNKFNPTGIFAKITTLAQPYQDKRADTGHAAIVTKYAHQLVKLDKLKPHIIIPAAILHDIGWSQLSKTDRMSIFDPKQTPVNEHRVRRLHEKEGASLAKKILQQVKYPEKFIPHILQIISGHDTREGFYSPEDGYTRDADKLWRFSKTGFSADIRRNKFSYKKLANRLIKHANRPDFFYSERAKSIAFTELNQRRLEYLPDKKFD